MDIYELINSYELSEEPASRATGKLFDNLNDRRGIKQSLQSIDGDTLEEMFSTIAEIIGKEYLT